MLFLIPLLANAENIDLLCIAGAKDQPLSYDIDTSLNTVTHGNEQASSVSIDKYKIAFFLPGPSPILFSHIINRSTGRMTVANKDLIFSWDYVCDKNRPKF